MTNQHLKCPGCGKRVNTLYGHTDNPDGFRCERCSGAGSADVIWFLFGYFTVVLVCFSFAVMN